jgi:hypothetical protein
LGFVEWNLESFSFAVVHDLGINSFGTALVIIRDFILVWDLLNGIWGSVLLGQLSGLSGILS